MDSEHCRLVPLGAVRAAIADEFWHGEPARALLEMHSSDTLWALLVALFHLADELYVGEDEAMVSRSLEPASVLRAPPRAMLDVMQSPMGKALTSVMDGRRPGGRNLRSIP